MLVWPEKVEYYKKVEKYKLKKYKLFWNHMQKIRKKNNYKIWWYWNPKTNISPT